MTVSLKSMDQTLVKFGYRISWYTKSLSECNDFDERMSDKVKKDEDDEDEEDDDHNDLRSR